jgi:hypothetical protein
VPASAPVAAAPAPAASKAAAPKAKAAARSEQRGTAAPLAEPSPPVALPDPIAVAQQKFNAGEHAEVITLLESTPSDNLGDRQKKLRVILLLQSYEVLGRHDDALATIEKHPVSDGLFYLIKSQVALRQNQLETALDAAREAQSAPALIDNGVRKKATFQTASILHTRFSLKPNTQNTQLAREAWESYLSLYCSGDADSKECREATEKLSVLEQ